MKKYTRRYEHSSEYRQRSGYRYTAGYRYIKRYSRRWQHLKSVGAFLLILILLPYIFTVFFHGADRGNRISDMVYVKVEAVQAGTDGKEKVLTEVPLEEYFLGVLALEAPENSEPEMLKAQAVLTRTKLWQQKGSSGDVVFTERYLSAEELRKHWGKEEYEKQYRCLDKAMRETENQVLFYGEEYAWTPFHKSSNGMTRNAQEVFGTEEYPYLTARECPLDKEAEKEIQVVSFPYREVQEMCRPFLVAVTEEDAKKTYGFADFEIVSVDTAGYVKEFRIGETICSGDEFRDALSLASSAFSIQDKDGCLQITTEGVGHGLGMSQWTAQAMAKEGKGYEEILQYFFGGTELKTVEGVL